MPSFNRGLLVVIDSSVPNQDLLASGVHPSAQIACLAQRAGLGEVAQVLSRTQGPARELHLVAHGVPGVLHLGGETWTAKTVRARAGEWAAIGKALGPDGVIALTACYVVFGDEGRSLLSALAEATGCRVTGTEGLVGGQDAESFALHPALASSPFSAEARAAYAPTLAKPKFLAPIQVSDVAAGIGGFAINADTIGTGFASVSNAGDVNGDGLNDLIFGVPYSSPYGIPGGQGTTYVVFGKSDGTAVDLSDVRAGSGGFSINGVSPGDRTGGSVSTAGDVNGDGLADLIIGSRFADPNGIDSGSSYVVFGKSDSANVQLSDVVAGTGGFVINGASSFDESGYSVRNAGDVNGDGLDDLLVGARGDSPNGLGSGAAFVIFGRTDNSAAVELSDVEAGTGGFVINGVSGGDVAGWSVSGAGDVNGDGLDDLVVGAPGDDPNGLSSGAAFIVYGKSDTAALALSDLEFGAGGVTWNGVSAYDRAGTFVRAAGDFDGDGFDDVIVLAPGNSDKAYVVRGTSDPFGFPPTLGDLGLNIFGVPNGFTVSGAGDVNGDGFDDVIVGSEGASSHVVFGRQNISGQVVQISDVDAGIGGFAITSGGQASGIGDLNGDGLDDLLVATKYGGESYVVFGRAAVDLVVTSDSGSSNKDNVTSDTTPTIAFQVDAGTVMEVDWDDGNGFVAAGVATGLLQQVTLATPYTVDGVKNIQVRANGATTSDDDVIETLAVTIDTTGPGFLPKVELSDIEAGTGGFVVNGVTAGDRAGYSVSNAGDVNGDGLDDLIVGAMYAGPNGLGAGASYIVFGKTGDTAPIELSDVEAGTGGFAIFGANKFDLAGFSVSNAGDVNGDGLDDVFVGTPTLDANGFNSGGGFVVFGKSDGSVVELSDVAAGTGGFVVNGVSEKDQAGFSVSGAGDVNGDGLDDLIIGAKHDDPNGDFSGASFVVFGKSDGAAAELSDVEAGSGGFVINGVSAGDQSGRSVSSAGDVNGDGLDDVIVGAYRDGPNGSESGASFVVFGKTGTAAVELSDVEAGTGGFVINGVSLFDESGFSVSDAGDVNGDGLDDLIVGAKKDDPNGYDSGAAFVVFGKSDGAAVELSDVEAGSGGFVINGVFNVDTAGESVSGAGDINGDGLDDLIVGASGHDTNNISAGASFVVFGKTDGAPVELEEVATNAGGFAINGISVFDRSGRSVSEAGDVNGDGLADLIVGAPYDNPHGNDSGASFVIFGRPNGLDLLASSDDGAFDNDNQTTDTMPTIEFTVEAGAVLEIDWDDGNGFQALGVATGQAQQATLAAPYATTGTKTIQMRTTDAAGNEHTEMLAITIEPIQIQGTAFGDTLFGNTQDNLILAFDGDDILIGGPGADVLNGGGGVNTASYQNAAAGVTADLVAPANNTGEAAGDTYASIQNLTGSQFGDFLWGSFGANIIEGLGGNDYLFGRAGNDTLNGGAGDDVLEGGADADTLNGGADSNTASYSLSGPGLVVDLVATGKNTGDAAGDSYSSIQNLTGSGFADELWGSFGANRLDGSGGHDTLFGRSGVDILNGGTGGDVLEGGADADQLNGGAGNNTASYALAGAGLTVDLISTGKNTGDAAGDTFSSIQNVTGSTFSDDIWGTFGANVLDGGVGGADRLQGRAGNDTLLGGDGNDRLDGGAGGDLLDGGAGDDWAWYLSSGVGITIDMATSGNNSGDAAGDSYVSVENIQGSFFDDVITGDGNANFIIASTGDDKAFGSGGDDTLHGQGGDDILVGGAGADILQGGVGSDTASYEDAGAGVVADLILTGTNTGDAAGDSYAAIRNLTGSAFNDTLRATFGTSILDGGGGDDVLQGRGGSDTYTGGAGDDLFIFQNGFGVGEVITDFDAFSANEKIDLKSVTNITDFADLAANHLSQVGPDAVITDGAGTITLLGVQTTDLDAGDFAF